MLGRWGEYYWCENNKQSIKTSRGISGRARYNLQVKEEDEARKRRIKLMKLVFDWFGSDSRFVAVLNYMLVAGWVRI